MLKNVLRYIRERALLRAGDRVAVAVSGGADSVALLRVLLELRPELGIALAVAHFNHGLRGDESSADEAFVADLANQLRLEFFAGRGEVREHAFTSKLSIEAAGRELRYLWLAEIAVTQRFDAVATAHTLDDQAETVLLKFLRGAGSRGLAGIYPEMFRDNPMRVRFVRPLLSVTRQDVESYLAALGQQWREDESNLDRRFTRNRVRHDLLPLLEREFNPNIRQALSDAAEMARAEEEYWTEAVERELEARVDVAEPGGKTFPVAESRSDAGKEQIPHRLKPVRDDNSSRHVLRTRQTPCRLSLDGFFQLPLALQRRILKGFAEHQALTLDFEHIEKMRRCAAGDLARTELPGGWLALPRQGFLELRPAAPASASPPGYEYVLPVPGEIVIVEIGITLRALLVAEEFAREAPEASLLRADLLGPELVIRNWRPGDRFWPAHNRSEEKLKRLFAERHIPAEERPTWPVVLKGTEIVWVRGFPVAKAYQWKGEGDAVMIEQRLGEIL